MWADTLVACGIVMFWWAIAWWIASLLIKRSDVADTAWGLGFILICMVASCTATSQMIPMHTVGKLVFLCVSIWGLRLSYHITKRNLKRAEDHRYAARRKQWGRWFAVKSLLVIFLLQAALTIVVAMPALAVMQMQYLGWSVWSIVGLGVWLIGFVLESISDYQLKNFLRTRTEASEVMQTGLWKYSRHPNYLGEITQWWGLFIVALSVPKGWWSVIGPITITFLIMKVSGIPLLEEKMTRNEKYREYAKRTPKLVPRFTKQA